MDIYTWSKRVLRTYRADCIANYGNPPDPPANQFQPPLWIRAVCGLHWVFFLLALIYFPMPTVSYFIVSGLYVLADSFIPIISEIGLTVLMLVGFISSFSYYGINSPFCYIFFFYIAWHLLGSLFFSFWFKRQRLKSQKETEIEEIIMAQRKNRPFSAAAGKIDPYTETMIKTETDYDSYLRAFAEDTLSRKG